MTRPAGQCPSCGAPVEFRWADAVQTVCPYCSSVLVRHDVALERVGKVSAPPSTDSRIQLGTEGEHRGRSFRVVGRIAYRWERGAWNEWHVVSSDGRSAWLAEADGQLSLTAHIVPPPALPAPAAVRVGETVEWGGARLRVTEVVRARYQGTEGDLPFEYWNKDEVLFADLRSEGAQVATVDYSEEPPLLFAGEWVEWDALKLSNLREIAAPKASARTLRCTHCGGPVEVRAEGRTVTVACARCGSLLDARDPGLKVLQTFQNLKRITPRIPLGSRGRMHGAEWDVVGFQVRSVREEGVDYPWSEYVLFNPERGFRYLTEERGHWNDAVPLHSIPTEGVEDQRPTARVNGETFKHYATAEASTVFVLGEFPWEVHVGDKERVRDYVHPPRMLSGEDTAGETAWSVAEYLPARRVWETFSLPGEPPAPQGVYANQPSPHTRKAQAYGRAFWTLMGLFLVLSVGRCATAAERQVYRQSHAFAPGLPEDSTAVEAGPIVLTGRPAALKLELDTDLSNAWAFFAIALVNEETGTRMELGREVSEYHGVEDGERWTEGDDVDGVRIPSVPPGRYTLLIDPESEVPVNYTVTLTHDTPSVGLMFVVLLLLIVPALVGASSSIAFEHERWEESDYAPEDDED